MRVLYVDDDRLDALLFVQSCRAAGGAEVQTAGSGAQALELAAGFDACRTKPVELRLLAARQGHAGGGD